MSDWQVVLQGLTMGAGTNYEIGPAGISGLGVPKTKTADVDLDSQHGAYGSPDYLSVRVLLIPITVSGDNAADAFDNLELLNTAWGPVQADVEITITLPGWGTFSYMGRPRGLDVDPEFAKSGEFSAIGEFHALDPVATPGS
jgi:hypothetical protein